MIDDKLRDRSKQTLQEIDIYTSRADFMGLVYYQMGQSETESKVH